MVTIQFFEGRVSDGQLLDTVMMAAAPQIGATVQFDIEGDRPRQLQIISVQHVIEIRKRAPTIESHETLIRCGTDKL